MKRLNNILSYLWSLLLFLTLTTCSDWEEIVVTMQMEEEVELTIQANVPEMKAASRTAPSEAINSITALAFDSDSKLIKVVKALLTDKQATSGNLKIKVPKRTQDIHFFAENNAETTSIDINIGDNVSTLLEKTSDKLYYWGKTTYSGNNNISVTLIRNMAKVNLDLAQGLTGHIAGFLYYNEQGTLVPSDFNVGTINPVSSPASHDNGNLGTEHYLFEHANEKNNNPLYAICKIDGLYYKIAFATTSNVELNHFPIVRNHKYNIQIKEIETALGNSSYSDAINRDPINNAVVQVVELGVTASTNELYYNHNKQLTVTATVPEGVSALAITAPEFDVATTSYKVTKTSDYNYNYTANSADTVVFTFTLKNGSYTDNQPVNIQFAGTPAYGYEVTNPEAISITLKQQMTVNIEAEPSATSLYYAASSVEDLLVNVTIPKEVSTLTFTSDYFDVAMAGSVLTATVNAGEYTVAHAVDENPSTSTTIRLRLKEEKKAETTSAGFTFNGTGNNVIAIPAEVNNITLAENGDANVRWQGSVPLNSADYATIVPLKYEWFCDGANQIISTGSILNLEFTVTGGNGSTLQVFEICGTTPETDWNSPVHQFAELNNSNVYTATGDGNVSLLLTLSDYTFTTIKDNFRSDFLGETTIAMAIRGAGITLTKVSILPPGETPTNNILITAPGGTEGVSSASVDMTYSNQSAIEEYTITVTVPDGVTELNYTNNGFSNVYIGNDSGWYNDAQSSITISDNKSIPLRLRVDKNSNSINPTITFSATNAVDATFMVNREVGSSNSDVLWEGALQFQGYDVHISKIDIPNNLLQGKLLDGAVLTLEYEVIDENNDFISIHGSGIETWANLREMANEYTDNESSEITMRLNPTIIENIGNGSINMQGSGRVLKKVTLTPPANMTFNVLEETISLDLQTNETVLHIQKPENVTQLNITDNENLFGVVSTTFDGATVNGNTISNLPSYAATIPVTLTINRVVDIKDYTITVNDGNGSSDNVTINLLSTWSGSYNLGNWEGFWGSARKLPVGTTVQITFADYNDCSFELHTYNSDTQFGYDIRLNGFSTDENNDNYISCSHLNNGVFSFTVATDGSVLIRDNGNLSNVTNAGIDGLQINGGNGLSITQVTITSGSGETPTATSFAYNFEDGVEFDEWNNFITTDIVSDDDINSNVLKLVVTETDVNNNTNNYNFGQIGISNGNFIGSYTLSIKYRAESSTGKMNLVFQDEDNNYVERAKYVEGNDGNLSTSWKTITWNLTFNEHADQFLIQFETVTLPATFYIDDLTLVKNN